MRQSEFEAGSAAAGRDKDRRQGRCRSVWSAIRNKIADRLKAILDSAAVCLKKKGRALDSSALYSYELDQTVNENISKNYHHRS